MSIKLSPAADRALSLIVKHGRAVASPGGFWAVKGYAITWQVGKQLQRLQLVERVVLVGEHQLVPTVLGAMTARPFAETARPGENVDLHWDVKRIDPDADEVNEPESWSPPELRDKNGTPLAVDVAMKQKKDD